jgi:tRNA1(Val) A37 N6-methylase TrmN6
VADTAASGVETTLDAFCGGRLMLRQPVRGHRAGTDAMLLSACVPPSFAGLVDDVGAGVGTAGLALAVRCPDARVRLIENDPATAALAAENAAANLPSRANTLELDVLSAAARRAALDTERADLVITNPPFLDPASFRQSPNARRRAAHVIGEGGLAGWVGACLDMLAPKGTLVLIHRADAMLTLLEALGSPTAGVTLLPVYPRADGDASRLLLRLVRGNRAPLRIAPALVLHQADGRFTPEAERLHRGEAALEW